MLPPNHKDCCQFWGWTCSHQTTKDVVSSEGEHATTRPQKLLSVLGVNMLPPDHKGCCKFWGWTWYHQTTKAIVDCKFWGSSFVVYLPDSLHYFFYTENFANESHHQTVYQSKVSILKYKKKKKKK